MNIALKVAYWIVTLLMCAIFIFSAQMYFRNTGMVQGYFQSLGYPAAIVIPLAIAKVLGVIAVTTDKVKILTHLAYAGFLIDVILATIAHVGEAGGFDIGKVFSMLSFRGIILVLLSWFLLNYRYDKPAAPDMV